MEVNDKVKELEDELKLLKAEIRNVLLDIREVVLERKNPLGEEHESAHLTLDVNTTARAMAAEAAAGEVRKAAEAVAPAEEAPASPGEPLAEPAPVPAEGDETDPPENGQSEDPDSPDGASADAMSESDPESEDVPAGPAAPAPDEPVATAEPATGPLPDSEQPVATATEAPPKPALDGDIPEMFMADLAPLSGDGSIADWVTNAIDTVGVEDLRRVIVMFRLWGNVPPNISRALGHLQGLLASSDEPRPAWLKVLQDLDRLAAL
jgi:hypothetical protein